MFHQTTIDDYGTPAGYTRGTVTAFAARYSTVQYYPRYWNPFTSDIATATTNTNTNATHTSNNRPLQSYPNEKKKQKNVR